MFASCSASQSPGFSGDLEGGVAVQSRDWPKFTVLGFASPSSSNGNFSTVYQDFRDDRKVQEWLAHAVSVMQEVIEPKGEITYKCF